MVLEKIKKANDIKKIPKDEMSILADEIREFIINAVGNRGGHLASNLGIVELTMALHLAMDLPKDKIIFDVGHQCYTHKILTGRKDEFEHLREYGGMSGFPKPRENKNDVFSTGHSSTSISAALGMVKANEINKKDGSVVAVIGDGALTGGMAFEALNNASGLKKNLIIILNDNNMSISKNVGGMNTYLTKVRAGAKYNDLKNDIIKKLNKIPYVGPGAIKSIKTTKSSIKQLVIPGMFFENMGINYLGPVDGSNIPQLVEIIKEAKKLEHAVLIHVMTKKGKGYEKAEKNPSKFHGISPFDIKTGEIKNKNKDKTYTDVFSDTILDLAEKNDNIAAITAAMPDGTGLKTFSKRYPERFFDVGIAEEHAVTFAAGLASQGIKPYVAIYSSFLQRAYDQILHDVCIQDLGVVFAVDRAGLVGEDGETHQGIFDLSFLGSIPNMNIFAPKNIYELEEAIKFSYNFKHPLAIRYPRGKGFSGLKEYKTPISFAKSEVIFSEKDIALMAVGSMVEVAYEVRDMLKEKGFNVTLINARFVKPLDEELLREIGKNHKLLVTLEENVTSGGFGERVCFFVSKLVNPYRVMNISIPNIFVEQGNVNVLKQNLLLDKENVFKRILKYIDETKIFND